ncbi:MAG TPA: glycosyltransferase [Myxococcota bacterium]|nr:glycosyltransferase [Myxococcota bacterium]
MALHLVYEKAHTASTRIRLVQMAPHLEARGIACRVIAYPRGARERGALRESVSQGDVVLIHRARPTPREARFWRALPAARIYDFDDAVMWGRRRGWRGAWTRRRRAAGFARALSCSDAATCGNAFLAAQCGDLPTAIVPSAVPLDVPLHTPRADAAPFRVGWIGRATNLRYVREVGAALAELARRIPLEVICVSDGRLALPGCRVVNVRWTREGEAEAVAQFDAGIMPLALDEPWSRGKCAYKLLQYMAAGVPAVGSDVGMNADLIESGTNGMLARGARDWIDALSALAADAPLRARIGRAGRETARAYGYPAVADRLAEFVSRVAAGRSAAR